MWSEEETNELYETWARGPGDHHRVDSLKAVATRAVELVRARGGTMTADEVGLCLEDTLLRSRGRLADHLSAQGARVAELEAEKVQEEERLQGATKAFAEKVNEVNDLRAELARLKLSGQVAEDEKELTEWLAPTDGSKIGRAPKRVMAALSRLATGAQRTQQAEQERDEAERLGQSVVRERDDARMQRDEAQQEAETLRAKVKELEEHIEGIDASHEDEEAAHAETLEQLESARTRSKDLEEELAQWKRGSEVSFHEAEGLKRERDAARAEVERLKGAAARASAELRHAYRPETRDWNLVARAIRILEEAATPKMTECRPCSPTCTHGDAPKEEMPKGSLVIGDDGAPVMVTRNGLRYPCSPTCTHDDAATPGHPGRVRERSEAVLAAICAEVGGAHGPVRCCPGCVRGSVAPSQLKCYAPKHINCPCGWAPPQTCHYPTPDVEPTEASWEESHDLQKAHDRGAEDMREACWEAVRLKLETIGWRAGDPYYDDFNAAIEGATP